MASAVLQVLLSRTGPLWLAIEARYVDEIAEPTEPAPVPRAPEHIRGIVSLHGHVLPLIDLQRFFQPEAAGRRPELPGSTSGVFQRIAVVSVRAFTVGLLCHQVVGVIGVPESALLEPRAAMSGRLRSFVSAEIQLQDTVAALLDLASLLEAAKVGV